MRTFPRALATFRKVVEERGGRLRELTFEELQDAGGAPIEELTVESRSATIGIIVEPCGDEKLRVVIQGFLKARLFPGDNVALDGFYKHRDGTLTPMTNDEFHNYD